jgi:hypothetical protein
VHALQQAQRAESNASARGECRVKLIGKHNVWSQHQPTQLCMSRLCCKLADEHADLRSIQRSVCYTV